LFGVLEKIFCSFRKINLLFNLLLFLFLLALSFKAMVTELIATVKMAGCGLRMVINGASGT